MKIKDMKLKAQGCNLSCKGETVCVMEYGEDMPLKSFAQGTRMAKRIEETFNAAQKGK